MATTANKHIILVEIAWDTGTEGYSYERYRTPSLDYQDILVSISDIAREASPFGSMNFPKTSIVLSDLDRSLQAKWSSTPHRNKTVTVKIIPPNGGIGDAITVFVGTVTRARLQGGKLSFEVSGNNFEELFDSDMSHVLPVLNKSALPNLPDGQIPTIIPLVYGRLSSNAGEDLADQLSAPAAIPAYLADTAGTTDLTWDDTYSLPTTSVGDSWNDVLWVAELSLYIAVGREASTPTGYIATSPDGVTWTSRTTPANQIWQSIAWSPTLALLVIVGNLGGSTAATRVATSPDGINWTSRTAANTNGWVKVIWIPELGGFLSVANSGASTTGYGMISTNGTTWSSVNITSGVAAITLKSAAWSPELGLITAVGSNTGTSPTTPLAYTSLNGTTWTKRDMVSGTQSEYSFPSDICWSSELGIFVAVGFSSGAGNRAWLSDDGITWYVAATPVLDYSWNAVIWIAEWGMFLASSLDGATTGDGLMASPDGVDWNFLPTATAAAALGGVTWSKERNEVVAVSYNNVTGFNDALKSPVNYDLHYKYALGVGTLSGDASNTGYSEFVFRYGTRIPSKKTLFTETVSGVTVTGIAFTLDQRDDTRPDEQELTFYGSGIRTGGAGTGPYLNPAEIKEHFLLNWAGVTSGQIDATAQSDAEAAAEVQHLADDDSTGVAPASCGMLVQDLHESIRSVIEKLDASFGMLTTQMLNGKIGTFVLTLGAEGTASIALTDENDVLKDSFVVADPETVATVLQLNFSNRGTRGGAGDPSSDSTALAAKSFSYELPRAKSEMFGASSNKFIEQDLNMPYCRRVGTAINVARAVSEFLRPYAEFSEFDIPISYFDDIDLLDYITLTHWLGVGASGYATQNLQVLELTTNLDPLGPRLHVKAFKRAPGLAVHDNFDRTPSNTVGSSWNESESAATAIKLATAPAEGDSINQTNCLFLTDAQSGEILWNATTDNDQVASVQIVRFVDGNGARFGVSVRASGAYSNHTGYVLRFDNDSSGVVWVRLYKCSGTNLGSADGTVLAEQQLNFLIGSTSTWRGQGDILEVRALGTTIEGWYFSDIPANNYGKLFSVTDSAIASGNFGIISRDGGGTYLTNFYGRSYT